MSVVDPLLMPKEFLGIGRFHAPKLILLCPEGGVCGPVKILRRQSFIYGICQENIVLLLELALVLGLLGDFIPGTGGQAREEG